MRLADSSFRSVARSLAIDLATADVVSALRSEGVEAIVLRGPAIARRIYESSELRPYIDLDLLVAPTHQDAAASVLRELGFAPVASETDLTGFRPVHAHEWLRPQDGVAVDLHATLSGVGIGGEALFASLLAEAETELLGGTLVNMPSHPAVALETALHAAHHGPRREKSLCDLEHALERLPEPVWRDAAAAGERARRGSGLRRGAQAG